MVKNTQLEFSINNQRDADDENDSQDYNYGPGLNESFASEERMSQVERIKQQKETDISYSGGDSSKSSDDDDLINKGNPKELSDFGSNRGSDDSM